jgi:hypothetical protein
MPMEMELSKRVVWKMQHVEVKLYENEEYEYGQLYAGRITVVVKEYTKEVLNGVVCACVCACVCVCQWCMCVPVYTIFPIHESISGVPPYHKMSYLELMVCSYNFRHVSDFDIPYTLYEYTTMHASIEYIRITD